MIEFKKDQAQRAGWDNWVDGLDNHPCPPAGEGVHKWLFFAGQSAKECMNGTLVPARVLAEVQKRATRPLQRNGRELLDVLDASVCGRSCGVYEADMKAKPISREAMPKWEMIDCRNRYHLQDESKLHLQRCFKADEGVCICPLEHAGTQVYSGLVKSRSEWVAELPMLFSQRYGGGVYIRINPTTGASDADVTAYRFCLVEGDTMPIAEQERLLLASGLPIMAMIESGGKSVHSWIYIGAKDIAEFHKRRARVWKTLDVMGFKVDTANKNPSRYSRLAGCMRGSQIQRLLYLGVGKDGIAWR